MDRQPNFSIEKRAAVNELCSDGYGIRYIVNKMKNTTVHSI